MQLKKLEAYGFKSFADKIEVEFDKGITSEKDAAQPTLTEFEKDNPFVYGEI